MTLARTSRSTHLANEHVGLVEVAAEHFRGLAGDRLDLDAHFHALAGRRHVLVVALDRRHTAEIFELQGKRNEKSLKQGVGRNSGLISAFKNNIFRYVSADPPTRHISPFHSASKRNAQL